MNLNMFNQWRDLTTWDGITLQFQTSKKDSSWITYIREAKTKQLITYGLSRTSKDESFQRAEQALKQINIEGVRTALETKHMIRPNDNMVQSPAQKDIDWRDGANHRYKAQRDIVDGRPQRQPE